MNHRLATLLIALLLPLTAAAQDPDPVPDPVPPSAASPDEERLDESKELYANGNLLYDEGNYEMAALAFEEAYASTPLPALLFNISSAWERAGDLHKAIEYLNRYRVYAPADERPTLERRLTSLETRLAESEVAPAPAPAPVVEVAPEPVLPSADATDRRPRRGLALAALGVGGASLVTGTVFALRADSARQSLDSTCQSVDGKLLCSSAAEADLQTNRVSSSVADGAFVFGGIAILGGAALAVFTDAPIQPMPNGLRLHGRF